MWRLKNYIPLRTLMIILVGQVFWFPWTGRAELSSATSSQPSKILAAYWGISSVNEGDEQLRLLSQGGLNTALVKDVGFVVNSSLWREWGELARKHRIALLPVLNFAGKAELENAARGDTAYTDRHGSAFPSTPCPLDVIYWQTSIEQRFTRLARIAKKTQISGLIFDTEMYGRELSIYSDFCFCDNCWEKFFRSLHIPAPQIPAALRAEYLIQENMLSMFSDFQEKQLQKILFSLKEQIHEVNPLLSLGIVAYKNTWFYRNLIQGLGTIELPVLIFSETSYLLGYTPYIARERKMIRGNSSDIPSIARYIPGIWLGRFFPETLPEQLYELASHTDGYWLFSADSLWKKPPQSRTYALHGSSENYWNAFKRAHDEIQHFSQNPQKYRSDLPPIHLSSFYDSSQRHLITQPSLRSLFYNIMMDDLSERRPPRAQASSNILYRGTVLFHAFRTQSNSTRPNRFQLSQQSASHPSGIIHLTHVPIAEYRDETHYKFFDGDGKLLREGSLNRQNKSGTLDLYQSASGLSSLLVESGLNAVQVHFSGTSFLVEASSTFPLSTFNTSHSYTTFISPSQEYFSIRAYCSEDEPALLTIASLDKKIKRQFEALGYSEELIPLNDSELTGTFGTISVTPIPFKAFEDVTFSLVNSEFPYVFIDPPHK